MKSLFILTSALLFTANVLAENDPLWMRYPQFLQTVKRSPLLTKAISTPFRANGGKATQLTTHPAHDTRPIWSPDGARSRLLLTGTEISISSSWIWKEAARNS